MERDAEGTKRTDESPGAGDSAGADAHIGAVEGDRPSDPQHFNRNVPALDDRGLPADRDKICQDVLGANVDETRG
jgi:hypothetical protein